MHGLVQILFSWDVSRLAWQVYVCSDLMDQRCVRVQGSQPDLCPPGALHFTNNGFSTAPLCMLGEAGTYLHPYVLTYVRVYEQLQWL